MRNTRLKKTLSQLIITALVIATVTVLSITAIADSTINKTFEDITEVFIEDNESVVDLEKVLPKSRSTFTPEIESYGNTPQMRVPIPIMITFDQILLGTLEGDCPLNFYIVGNDESSAKVVCSMYSGVMYELIIGKADSKDSEAIIDDTPFIMDMYDEYAACLKFIHDNILYYYDGYLSVVVSEDDEVVVKSRDFIINALEEYEDPFDEYSFRLADDITNTKDTFDMVAEVGDSVNGSETYVPNNTLMIAGSNREEIEPNNTYSQADRTYDYDNMYGRIYYSSSDIDWYKVSFSSAGQANFWLGEIPSGCDYDLYLYTLSETTLTERGKSREGSNKNELIAYNVS